MRALPAEVDLTPLTDPAEATPGDIISAAQALAAAVAAARDQRITTYLVEAGQPVALITPVDVGTLIGICA
jgi:hypothetical protein